MYNDFINDAETTERLKDVYQFIEHHDDVLCSIFNDIYKDLKNFYDSTSLENDNCIMIKTKDSTMLDVCLNTIRDCVSHHLIQSCDYEDTDFLKNYIFRIVINGNIIKIIKKR